MENIRCVIAGIPQKILADIVQNTLEDNGLVEVVERVNTDADIASAIASHSAEVLILGMKRTELPAVCTEVMNRVANLLVIGLVDDGRRLAVLLDNASKNDIPKIVSTLRRTNSE